MDSVIHVKATHEGEVRRFQCRPSFEILESSLRTIFACKPTDQILITFLDDENEYCRISCQIELDYAVTLPSPLRLVMKLVSPKPVPQVAETHPTTLPNEAVKARLEAVNAALETPNLPPHKREKLNHRKECLSAQLYGQQTPAATRVCNRERVLEERLAMINSAMEQPNLPAHRYENLSRRKDAIIAKLHGLPSSAPASCSSPLPAADVPHPCTQRLQARLVMINTKLEQPDLQPPLLEKLNRKKALIEAKLAVDSTSVKSGDRTQFWQMRLNHINAALEHPDLPPQRRENLTQKKENLTAKLAGGNSNTFESKMDKTEFWQMRLKHINDALARPDLPAHRRENLSLKKAKFEEKLANGQTTPATTASPQPECNPWSRSHNFWGHGGPHGFGHHAHGPHHVPHGGPHHFPHGGPHHVPHGGPHHVPHDGHCHGAPFVPGPHGSGPLFGCPPPPEGFGCPLPEPAFGCPPPPAFAGPHHHPWARGPHGHPHGGHPGGWGQHGGRGHHLEAKLAWINQALEQPGLPPHKAASLAQRKAMIEAKIAQKGCSEEKPERAELVALRAAIGTAKVNLKNARQSGLKDAELAPFIDAVANAKAALVKRRLELKSAGPQL
jgi:hypothetical protein